MSDMDELRTTAAKVRYEMVETLIAANAGHPGGAFSSVEIMTALYFNVMNIDPEQPKWEGRDRFVLSKGHSAVGLYSVLYLRGFFDCETLRTFRTDNGKLSGHPDSRKTPGIDASAGSLGHGISAGAGIALTAKMDQASYKTYVLIGDGESQEGSVWEAAMAAAHYRLDNLVVVVDRNQLQIDGNTEEIMSLEPFKEKWEAFGWSARVINGNEMEEVVLALKDTPYQKDKPSIVIANTIKGKGISFMENDVTWHGGGLSGENADTARRDVALR